MKPIELKFSGINCFETEQTINFNELSKNGIFGIFGPTGSGKTTILDALSIALFGETARLGGNNYDFVNTRAGKAEIELTFLANKTYTIKRTYKLKKNAIESTAVLYENDKIIAEGPRNVKPALHEIVGMTISDYSKCIALPQGDFSAFLKSNAAERTNLIGKLFSLEQYGEELSRRAKNRKVACEQRCEMLEGQIDLLGQNLSQEIDERTKQINDTTLIISSIDNEIAKLQEKIDEQNKIKEQNKKYSELLEQKNKLEQEEAVYLEKKKLLSLHKQIVPHKNTLLELEDEKEQIKRLQREVKSLEEEYKLASFDVSQLSRAAEEIEKRAKTLENSDQTIIDLEKLSVKEAEIRQKENQATEIKSAILKCEEEIKTLRAKNESELSEQTIDESRLQQLEAKKIEESEKLNQLDSTPINGKQQKELLQKILTELGNNFDLIQKAQTETNSKIELRNKKSHEIESKIGTILFKLAIKNSAAEELEKHKALQATILHAKSQLGWIYAQQQKLEEEKATTASSKQQEQAIITECENAIEALTNLKTQADSSVQEISKSRDNALIDMAEATVSSETVVGAPCPICGNTVQHVFSEKHTNLTYINNSILLARKNAEQIGIDIKQKEIEKANAEFKILQLDEQLTRLQQKEYSLKQLENTVYIKFVDINENAKENFELLEAKTISNIEKLEEAKSQIGLLESEMQQITSQNVFDGATISRMNEERETIFAYQEQIRKLLAEQELEELSSSVQVTVNVGELKTKIKESIERITKQIIALSKEIEIHKKNIESNNLSIDRLNREIFDNKSKISGIENDISVFQQDFERLCHGYNSIAEKLEKVKTAKTSIITERQQIAEKQAAATLKLVQAEPLYKTKFALLQDKQNKQSQIKEALAPVLSSLNLASTEEALACVLDNANEVETFILNFDHTKERIENELGSLLPPEKMCDENFDEQKQALNSQKSHLLEQIGALKEQINHNQKALEKQKTLTKELEKCKKEFATASHLCSLLHGKELLAFATDEYLKDITESASERLYNLLSGHYTLIYQNKEFFVIDNFDSGTIRSCSTLSGGETFVVSLCLALGISENILKLSRASSDFFFLEDRKSVV